MKQIIGANHRATRIDIALPVDESGEYVLDDNGDLIKGKEPVVITIPRYDCLTRDEFHELKKSLDALGEKKGDEEQSPHDRVYEEVTAVLGPFLDAEQLDLVGGLRLFELTQIAEAVQEANNMSLGELLASTRSSKSTAGRSKQTS